VSKPLHRLMVPLQHSFWRGEGKGFCPGCADFTAAAHGRGGRGAGFGRRTGLGDAQGHVPFQER